MADYPRVCEQCGDRFTAQHATSRFCTDRCRKRKSRAKPPVTARTTPDVDMSEAPATSTRALVLAKLTAAGREDTWEGACALALADRIDQATAVMGYAALIKQLEATMDRALAGVVVAADPVDELEARRAAKLAQVRAL